MGAVTVVTTPAEAAAADSAAAAAVEAVASIGAAKPPGSLLFYNFINFNLCLVIMTASTHVLYVFLLHNSDAVIFLHFYMTPIIG